MQGIGRERPGVAGCGKGEEVGEEMVVEERGRTRKGRGRDRPRSCHGRRTRRPRPTPAACSTSSSSWEAAPNTAECAQLCSGVDENAPGACAQLVFAPVDKSFANDAPLLPSGFHVIPLETKPISCGGFNGLCNVLRESTTMMCYFNIFHQWRSTGQTCRRGQKPFGNKIVFNPNANPQIGGGQRRSAVRQHFPSRGAMAGRSTVLPFAQGWRYGGCAWAMAFWVCVGAPCEIQQGAAFASWAQPMMHGCFGCWCSGLLTRCRHQVF